jgi:hypothetical protein
MPLASEIGAASVQFTGTQIVAPKPWPPFAGEVAEIALHWSPDLLGDNASRARADLPLAGRSRVGHWRSQGSVTGRISCQQAAARYTVIRRAAGPLLYPAPGLGYRLRCERGTFVATTPAWRSLTVASVAGRRNSFRCYGRLARGPSDGFWLPFSSRRGVVASRQTSRAPAAVTLPHASA